MIVRVWIKVEMCGMGSSSRVCQVCVCVVQRCFRRQRIISLTDFTAVYYFFGIHTWHSFQSFACNSILFAMSISFAKLFENRKRRCGSKIASLYKIFVAFKKDTRGVWFLVSVSINLERLQPEEKVSRRASGAVGKTAWPSST
jgi:hypothetical protein